ncbi:MULTISPECIES: GGDEF domain-containing response regulator [Thalassobaculum]|uniref:diguanylate cyclase n=1 Tax=Thalassobaculum litoreum DSM 18839 TaxID=1123362 RepID=A0A8G2BHA6_9PROT|nr:MULTISPECIES: diguanylate cyclase [Thalassobaculum]SDF66078.1 diguanylate cyclase (GGDEF) domain-containing protein [Thalassobaculum litoreum DSM 18839]
MNTDLDISGSRILIVDDARENVRILATILKDVAAVSFSLGGMDALTKAKATLPDLILLDIEMPDMNGHEVIIRLKSDPRTALIPVIFVTSHADVEDEEAGLRLGAIDYITKPFNPAIVRARVSNQLMLRAYAKQLEDLNVELERLATTDSLTGLANRRAFRERMTQELRRLDRYGGEACVMMMDLDHFKSVNDSYGHDAGDAVLREVAERVAGQLRETDTFGRLGGEEFAILAAGTPVDQGALVADRVLRSVREEPVVWNGLEITVTTSVGMTPLRAGDGSIDAALARADQALYASKNAGRDRLEVQAA